ncbi:MAG: thioredoxin domain-containing protein [Myxococcales bacterium]
MKALRQMCPSGGRTTIKALLLTLLSALVLAGCDGERPSRVPVAGSPQRGPSDAWVTLVEFADFQCPYCARAAGTVQQVVQAYPSTDLRVVFKHLPLSFHEHAMPAALAAYCAGEQGKFWEMYDLLFSDNSKLSDADLQADAQSLGLDVAAWSSCRSSTVAKDAIDRDVALSDEVGVSGTPTFFVNGYAIVGAESLETFQSLIDRELAKAKASGIDRARYYDQVVLGQ